MPPASCIDTSDPSYSFVYLDSELLCSYVEILQVKYTQSNWHERLTTILDDFPKVDDIHPFYADLLNVLYDRDHYKLALGQLSVARNLIDKVAQGEASVSFLLGTLCFNRLTYSEDALAVISEQFGFMQITSGFSNMVTHSTAARS